MSGVVQWSIYVVHGWSSLAATPVLLPEWVRRSMGLVARLGVERYA